MEYNTQRELMPIPEYGRNVHKMIEYTLTIEDRDKRTKAAHAIVSIMSLLNPHLREITDYKHKLWDHLYIISKFKLDVDGPYPMPSQETLSEKPKRIPYPAKNIKYRHFGKTTELMIQEIIKMEEGPIKEKMVEKIANFMKLSYLSWNRDSVDDHQIVEQLRILSDGQLKLSENIQLENTNDMLAKIARFAPSQKGKNKNRQNKRRNRK
jgi:hypothetical protein